MTTIQTVHFDARGSSLLAQPRSMNAQPGSYDVSILDSSMLNVLEHWSGDFQSASAPHKILTPPSQLDGTYLRLTSQVGLLPPFNAATVLVPITQDGNKLGAPSDTETSNDASVEVDVMVAFSASPPGKATAAPGGP